MAVPKPVRGEVWDVDLNPVIGHEQGGMRPALVVSADGFNKTQAGLVIVVPITSKTKGIRTHVPIDPPEGGLSIGRASPSARISGRFPWSDWRSVGGWPPIRPCGRSKTSCECCWISDAEAQGLNSCPRARPRRGSGRRDGRSCRRSAPVSYALPSSVASHAARVHRVSAQASRGTGWRR